MSTFELKKEKTFGSIQVKLYSYKEKNDELSAYIKQKIGARKQVFSELFDDYAGENLDKESTLSNFQKLSTPKCHTIPAFDVKRSTVSEFMAEFLLEKEFQCIFFDQANKKIIKSIVDTERHSAGVDVVGIQENSRYLKFIVAEVKASKENKIPCASAGSLKADIEKLLRFTNDRLYREISSMIDNFSDKSKQFAKYISFLLDLIGEKNALDLLVKRIIIFPFLIRNHPNILHCGNLNDFHNFSELNSRGTETIGIVWAINKDIDSFVNSIYSDD